MNQGLMVYSPIAHRHPGALLGLYPIGWEYWKDFDTLILSRCDALFVLMLDGWRESSGVKAEIQIAESRGLLIKLYEQGDEANEYLRILE
jgi:hypothetical protein